MIVRTVRDYFSTSPVLMDPEEYTAYIMLDIIDEKDWIHSYRTPPPRISARVVGTELWGEFEVVYIECSEEDLIKTEQWIAAIEDEEPERSARL